MPKKIRTKKILKATFLIALVMHFSYSLVLSLGVMHTFESFLVFDRSRVIINTFFALALLIAIIVEFTKFLNLVEKHSFDRHSLKWIIQRENLILCARLTLMALPFVISTIIRFFLSYELDTASAFDIIVLTYASIALVMAVSLILMYVIYKFILSKSWIETQDKEVDNLIWSLYFGTVFLDVENFDLSNQTIKFEEEVDNFLVTTNIENKLQTAIAFSNILSDTKKATTPPRV